MLAQALEPHRGAELHGEREQVSVGAAPPDIVAGDDHGVPAGEEHLGHGRDARRIGRGLEVEGARRQGRLGRLLLEHVDGEGDEDRPARRVLGDLQRAAQERGQLVGALRPARST